MEDKVFVAVGKRVKESKSTLLWALRNSGGKNICILHVHQPAQMIPMMGGMFAVNKLKEQEVRAFRELERKKMHKILNKYLLICALQGVRAEKLYIEVEKIDKGIIELISQYGIRKLVMGAAADKHFSKRMKVLKSKKAAAVYQQAEPCCKIWFVCNGCLIQTRECSSDRTDVGVGSPLFLVNPALTTIGAWQSDKLSFGSLTCGKNNHRRLTDPVQDLISGALSVNSLDRRDGALSSLHVAEGVPVMQGQSGAEGNADEREGILSSQGSGHSTMISNELASNSDAISKTGDEEGKVFPLVQESQENFQCSSPLKEPLEVVNELFLRLEQALVEVENSKAEVLNEFVRRRQVEKEAIEAVHKAEVSDSLHSTEVKQRKEMEEALAREKQETEKLKNQRDEVIKELQIAQEQKSVMESQIAESERMIKESKDKVILAVELLKTLKKERDDLQIEHESAAKEAEELRIRREEEASPSQRTELFTEFSFSEIKEATHNFDQSLKIGGGGYGSVYKGILRHTKVAIKVLDSHSLQGRLEFQQEVNVLSRVKHPNLVTLIGACLESYSLVYEYLSNGSLEDFIACKDNSVPLSWQTRIRIATEICSALVFLHSYKPHGIVHGDLKPANILLNSNFVTKLGDFGISRLILRSENSLNTSSLCCITDPKGTLLYMDPEFFATGELTPKSDVYSLGIILLRLLTGRPPFGIVKEVQTALKKGSLNALLDKSAGDWPFLQAKQLAQLALRCCELNRRSRPHLGSEVWRMLDQMTASSDSSSSFRLSSKECCWIPSNLICPIFQEITRAPHKRRL